LGTINLFLLITSSFVYTSGLAFMEAGNAKRLIQCCVATMAIGSLFLLLKFYEWHVDISEHLFPAGACWRRRESAHNRRHWLILRSCGLRARSGRPSALRVQSCSRPSRTSRYAVA
jgi:hypothetical protein